MDKKTTMIVLVAVVAVVIVAAAAVLLTKKGGSDCDEACIAGDWEKVVVYSGEWIEGTPAYTEEAASGEKAKISHYEDDFYLLEQNGKKLYCSWDGSKLVTAGLGSGSSAVFIAELPGNSNYMTVSYFKGHDAYVEVYKRAGYVGEYPGVGIPLILPELGAVIESFKLKEYTDEGPEDKGVDTMAVQAKEGRMLFFGVTGTDGYDAEYISIYLDSGLFLSLARTEDISAFELMQYRGGVFYTTTMVKSTGDVWVVEYGDEEKASYPDKDLVGKAFTGTEDAVIYKNGEIVEKISDNKIGLNVFMQDEGCLRISTVDYRGVEIALWNAQFLDLGKTYGIAVQSSIDYKGTAYHGTYYGYFDSKDCDTLRIYGALTGSDGSSIVISQEYKMDESSRGTFP